MFQLIAAIILGAILLVPVLFIVLFQKIKSLNEQVARLRSEMDTLLGESARGSARAADSASSSAIKQRGQEAASQIHHQPPDQEADDFWISSILNEEEQEPTSSAPRQEAPSGEPTPPAADSASSPSISAEETGQQPRAPEAAHAFSTDTARSGTGYEAQQQHVATGFDQGLEWLRGFFLAGNPIARIGGLILFCGVAFLLNYAASVGYFPLEARLALAGAAGVVLLILGWRLRAHRSVFAMVLQGVGIGVVYLTLFAATRLYHLLPVPAAFAAMVGLVALTVWLALLQDARSLAAFGSVGGFLAPVLISTGPGSHVVLFAYYALLNAGILSISWYRAWRELNLVGFLFTFSLGTLWGVNYYRPEHFATVEPFLILFFLMFVAIAVIYSFHQAPRLRDYVDSTLIFGVPFATYGLQASLVYDMHLGMASSAAALSFFYLALAWIFQRFGPAGIKRLLEAFLVLGVLFITLAVPLALHKHWIVLSWALEGAGLVWIGVRWMRLPARLFGVALQLMAGTAFFVTMQEMTGHPPLLNGLFTGALVLCLAGWVSAYITWLHRHILKGDERSLPHVLLVWGLGWWFFGGISELHRALSTTAAINGDWLLAVVTTAAGLLLAKRTGWKLLSYLGIVLMPVMALSGLFLLLGEHEHVLIGWAWVPWVLMLGVHYLGLRWFEEAWPSGTIQTLHALAGWVMVGVLTVECYWLGGVYHLSWVWRMTATTLPAIVAVISAFALVRRVSWPFAAHGDRYIAKTALPMAGALCLWALLVCFHDADPVVTAYLPVLNPMEIVQFGVLFLGAGVYCAVKRIPLSQLLEQWDQVLTSWAVVVYVLLNTVIARTVHHWFGVAYTRHELFNSAMFQTLLAVFWTLLAWALMLLATRRGVRPVWFSGAGLLGLVLVKLFLVDLTGVDTVARIVSFLGVGALMLVIGYVTPLPPRARQDSRG